MVILEKLRSENNCEGDLYKKLAQNITAIAVKDNKKCSINTYNSTETSLWGHVKGIEGADSSFIIPQPPWLTRKVPLDWMLASVMPI